MILINRAVTDHFKYSDFECHCCHVLKLSDLFYRHIALLEKLQELVKFPLKINSGYRCPKHNKAVGGKKQSMHLLFATDVAPENGVGVQEIYDAAVQLGFTGIGIYPTFVHLDLRPEQARWRG